MAYTSLLYHIIFSTKYRKRTFSAAIRGDAFRYIGGIVANRQSHLIEINGVDDHVHLLTSCSPKIALADFIRDIKAISSKWMHEEKRRSDCEWQAGYGAFTVSRSQVDSVSQYIRHQEEHHRERSFEEEFRAILERHGVEFDERYLFEQEHHG